MSSYNPTMQKARFTGHDVDIERIGRITKRTAKLDGVRATLVTFPKGASVAEDAVATGYLVDTELCPLAHVAYVVRGALAVRQRDESEEIFEAGDVMLLPPEHEAWTVGDEDCVFVEFSRGIDDYYARARRDDAPTGGPMKFTQIRNATLHVEFAGKKFLIDPMLAEKGGWPGFEGTVNSHVANPTVDLPLPIGEVLDVDAVILSHTHADHWDDAAKKLVPKDMLHFAQNEKDAKELEAAGFRNVRVLGERTDFDGITLVKTRGQHGRAKVLEGAIGELLGTVSGIVFQHPDEKTLYVAGDTVWYEGVDESLKKHRPDVVVLNSGDAKLLTDDSIIMGKQDVYEVARAAPNATVIASHMEAVNHATLSRSELREFLGEKGVAERVRIPADGESYTF